MSGPTTQAGKALARHDDYGAGYFTEKAVAIEAEAAKAERERLRVEWEFLLKRRASDMHDVGHMSRIVKDVLLAEPEGT